MLRSAFQPALAFCFLLVPAGLLAWFHHAYFPAVLVGTRDLWGTQKPLPTGFAYLCQFGFVAYLPLGLIAIVAALSWRFPVLRGAFCLACCACFLGVVCVIYLMMMSTPALAHGLPI